MVTDQRRDRRGAARDGAGRFLKRRIARRRIGRFVGVGAARPAFAQLIARPIVSATSAGREEPSTSIWLSKVRRTPPSMSSTLFSAWCSLTREPAGTGAVKRTLLEP